MTNNTAEAAPGRTQARYLALVDDANPDVVLEELPTVWGLDLRPSYEVDGQVWYPTWVDVRREPGRSTVYLVHCQPTRPTD